MDCNDFLGKYIAYDTDSCSCWAHCTKVIDVNEINGRKKAFIASILIIKRGEKISVFKDRIIHLDKLTKSNIVDLSTIEEECFLSCLNGKVNARLLGIKRDPNLKDLTNE